MPRALQVQIADLHFPVDAGPCRDPPTLSNGVAYVYAELLVERALDEDNSALLFSRATSSTGKVRAGTPFQVCRFYDFVPNPVGRGVWESQR